MTSQKATLIGLVAIVLWSTMVGLIRGVSEGLGPVEYIDVGATYYFNKNMSTFVDYKINLLDDSDFTKAAKVSTDNIVAVGLNYQF